MKQFHENGWRLYVGDKLIGIAYFRHSDQPFFICDFVPTPEYEAYRSMFNIYAKLVNSPGEIQPSIDPFDYYEENIGRLNIRLAPFGNVWKGDIFVAQIYDGNEAWLRPA